MYVNYKMHNNLFVSFIASFMLIFRLSRFAVARSQIISVPLFLLEVYFIEQLISTGKNKYIIYLINKINKI